MRFSWTHFDAPVANTARTHPHTRAYASAPAAALWHRLVRGCPALSEGGVEEVGLPIVADVYDFVEVSLELATNPQRRNELGSLIEECRGALFDDHEFGSDLAQFLWSVGRAGVSAAAG